jgi:hypothetical protein
MATQIKRGGCRILQDMMFCSEYSRAAEEQLFGTAKPVDVWFLIEHRGRWERDVTQSLPEETRPVVDALHAKFPRSRFGLIQQAGLNSGPLTGFVAISRESDPSLYRFEIDRLEDLTSIDITGDIPSLGAGMERREQPLFLVCTHGVHDRCCAKFGNALYQAMAGVAGRNVWQVSHVGGCRFAPNLVCLPDGIVYGRLRETDCSRIVESYRRGLIECSHLRGRSCYSNPVQAAEYFLRTARQLERLDDFQLAHAEETGHFEWRVAFHATGSEERYEVRLASEDAPAATFKSCSAGEPAPRQRFQLIDRE